MTMFEAFKQAQRERGYADAEIEERMKMCNAFVPMEQKARETPIPEGMERKVIEGFKSLSANVEQMGRTDPAALRRLREATIAKHNKGN